MQIAYPRCIHTHTHARARARPPGTRVFMYSNPRAHRVGRLLAFLIEPFILALAYAHTARHRICDMPRFAPRACVHTRKHIDYRRISPPYSPFRAAFYPRDRSGC